MAHFRASPHTRHVDIEGTFPTKYFELVDSHKTLNFPTFIAIPWRGITFLSHPLFRLSSRELSTAEIFTWRFYSSSSLSHVSNTIERIWYSWIFLAILTFCSSAAHEKLYVFKTQKVYYDLIKSAEKSMHFGKFFLACRFRFYFTLCEFTVMIFFFPEKVARDADFN